MFLIFVFLIEKSVYDHTHVDSQSKNHIGTRDPNVFEENTGALEGVNKVTLFGSKVT